MHVLFIHPAWPAQFGHVANYLATRLGWRCTFLTAAEDKSRQAGLPYEVVPYKVAACAQLAGYGSLETLPGLIDHMNSVHAQAPRFRPDLVVGHMTYGTLLFLRTLYACPFIGYYEYLPPPFWTEEMTFRREYPPTEAVRLSNSVYHAFTYLQLHAVDAAYTPTYYQRGTAPKEMRGKITVHHDGVDTELFQPRIVTRPVRFRGLTIDKDTRVVTYVARGLEAMRGFDIFMRTAKRIARAMNNVVFLIAGHERSYYGHELNHLPRGMSFKQWVLGLDEYDVSRFHFLGWLPLTDLAELYKLTDLHFYLTAPYTLSWSLVQAMASGCTLIGSATAPVQEAIDDGTHGLLADFDDVEGLAKQALRVLKDPAEFKPLGEAARGRALERYEMGKCVGDLARFFQTHAGNL